MPPDFREISANIPMARTFLRVPNESSCKTVHVEADDGEEYILKGSQTGRSAFNDQVVGRIAFNLGMPVPKVLLVDVPRQLISEHPDEMGHFNPGYAHASHFIPHCVEHNWFKHTHVPDNRPRFALLGLLYGWMSAAEKQFLYKTRAPFLVYSFDHDAFFPSGPDWSPASLSQALNKFADFDDTIHTECELTHAEMNQAVELLRRLDRQNIDDAIHSTPLSFGEVSDAERDSLAGFLWQRAQEILA